LWFRPNVEIGLGDDRTLFAFNAELAYWFPTHSPWRIYVGGGPALHIYHFDGGGGSDTPAGLNLLLGFAHHAGFFAEAKLGGLHTWDDRLPDYSAVALRARRDRVVKLIEEVRGLEPTGWPRDDALDRILFLAQLEGVDFFDRVLERPETNPQIYVNECSNAIFSLLKKEYDTPRTRALAATARLRAMPALLEQGRRTLARPVRLYS